jgi:hypothetical protein
MCDVEARRAECREGGIERAVIAPSPALGVELLPPDEAASVLAAYHEGVAQLGAPFSAWASVGWEDADPRELDARLDEGFVGLCLGAGVLADPRQADRAGPLLEVLQRRGRPLFVHPGPAGTDPDPAYPAWWPALTRYVAEMHAAWHGTAVFVRPRFPALRICFAMLAGLAPAHTERRASRGVALEADRHAYYDTSSYGPRACEAVIGAVGAERLVNGSDRPMSPPRRPAGNPALAELVGAATPRMLLDDPEADA